MLPPDGTCCHADTQAVPINKKNHANTHAQLVCRLWEVMNCALMSMGRLKSNGRQVGNLPNPSMSPGNGVSCIRMGLPSSRIDKAAQKHSLVA